MFSSFVVGFRFKMANSFLLMSSIALLLQLGHLGSTDHSVNCPDIVSRARWGARKSEQVDYQTFPIYNVIVGHTATSPCKTQAECARILSNIQAFNMDTLHISDIAYNFMIGGDGIVYQGRGWIQEGAHTLGWNSRSLGIAFIGNFEDSEATDDQMAALRHLLDCGVQNGFLSDNYKLFGQRQLRATLSPGFSLYLQLQDIPAWSEIV